MRRMHTNTISKEVINQQKPMTVQGGHLRKTPFEAFFNLSPLAISLVLALNPALGQANPTDGQVVGGKATIKQTSPSRVDINQTSNRAIIDWKSFSIGKNEQVNFNQPNANATILNRVTGNEVSSILGGLTANGKVFLVNPNGIYFGKGAQVNVGSLIASTANITNQNFMNGNLLFDQPGKAGAKIINEGNISINDAGIAAFVAPDVRNTGSIIAKLGKVSLAAGAAYSIDLYGDNLINLIVNEATLASLKDTSGTPLKLYVEQAGLIDAQGGYVQLSSATAKQLVDGIINMSGVTQVASVSQQGGKISLNAGNTGIANITGTLDASSQTNKGGQITVTGQDVNLSDTAKLSSTGTQGGTILIGGDYQGKGTLANAKNTNIAAGAVINAGEQGKVIAWSDNRTSFAGEILAKNGFVEVSGKEYLNFDGKVTAKTLLLDPKNIVIDDNSTISKANQNFYDISIFKTSALNNISGDVELNASDSIYVNSAINLTTSDKSLTLDATKGSVYLNNHITTNNGAVTIKAGKDIIASGKVNNIEKNGAYIDTLDTLNGQLRSDSNQGGNITLRANNGSVVVNELRGNDLTITAPKGNITLAEAIGGNSTNDAYPGIGKVILDADKGNVTLNGIYASGKPSVVNGSQTVVQEGLKVIAGNTITSNQKIVVKDGTLQFGDSTHQNSMILKDSIYSTGGYAIDVWPTLTLAMGEKHNSIFNTSPDISKFSNDNTELYAVIPRESYSFVVDAYDQNQNYQSIPIPIFSSSNASRYRIPVVDVNNVRVYVGDQSESKYIVPKIVISNNNEFQSFDTSKGLQKITLHNRVKNQSDNQKILLKITSFVGNFDKTTISSNGDNQVMDIRSNVTNKAGVNYSSSRAGSESGQAGEAISISINSLTDNTSTDFINVNQGNSVSISNETFYRVLINYYGFVSNGNGSPDFKSLVSNGLTSGKLFDSYLIGKNSDGIFSLENLASAINKQNSEIKVSIPGPSTYAFSIFTLSGNKIYDVDGAGFFGFNPRYFAILKTNISNGIGQIYKNGGVVYNTSTENNSFIGSDISNDIPITSSGYQYAYLIYDGGFLQNVDGSSVAGNSGTNVASGSTNVGDASGGSSMVDFKSLGNSIGFSDGGLGTPIDGGNQFLNVANQEGNVGATANNGSSENIQVVMGDNMANQADFGRGAGVGATSDVFANKYCVVAPSGPSVANQSFFGGCN